MNDNHTYDVDQYKIAYPFLDMADYYGYPQNLPHHSDHYQINDIVYIEVDEGKERHEIIQCYYGKIINKQYNYRSCYDVLKFTNNTIVSIDLYDDAKILSYIPNEIFQPRIDMHNEIKQKKIDTLNRSVEMLISKITNTKIAIK